jgi:3-hydroxyisobutyrate dehydrogenase-like beta-hydroxyacid dehydrogenase
VSDPGGALRVGFVGAGRIGLPMVRRLVAAGHRVMVSARTEEARTVLGRLGAVPCAEPAAAADGADVVALCVYSDQQVRDIALDGGLLAAMAPGSALVVHTTGSPTTVAALVEHARQRDVEVVDAPISGGPHDIDAGSVTLFVGATDAGLSRARPVLSAYGDPILHFGPPGAGQLVKLLNNAVFAANIGVVAEALRVARELGVEESSVLAGISAGSGSSRALLGIAATGSVATFAHNVGEFVGKDVAVVRAVGAELGVDFGVLAEAHRVLGGLLSPEHRAQLVGSGAEGQG